MSLSIPEDLIDWMVSEVGKDVYIRDRSHCVEIAITEFREKSEKLEKKV